MTPARTRETRIGRLNGKVAVITGANSGIGLASAKRFAHGGCDDEHNASNEFKAVLKEAATLSSVDRFTDIHSVPGKSTLDVPSQSTSVLVSEDCRQRSTSR